MNKNRIFLLLLLVCALVARAQTDGIVFADDSVRNLCVAHWDADGDGALSYEEAEAVTSLDSVFFLQTRIRSFDELQYFTGLKTLNRIALSDCYDLQSVTLPPTLEVLGERALWSCINITHLSLPPTLRRMEKGCLYHCKLLEDITIPGGVDSISEQAMMWCLRLKKVTLEEGVRHIGQEAFFQCVSLEHVALPSTLRSIEARAFQNALNIRIITCNAPVPPQMEVKTFNEEVFENAMLFVPQGAAEAYQSAPEWKNFRYITELF